MGLPAENGGLPIGKAQERGETYRKMEVYPLVNVYIAMENHHF